MQWKMSDKMQSWESWLGKEKYALSSVLMHELYSFPSMILEGFVLQILMYMKTFSCLVILIMVNKIIHLEVLFVSWNYFHAMNELVFFKYLQLETECHWISAVGKWNILWMMSLLELYYTYFHQYKRTAMDDDINNNSKEHCCIILANKKKKVGKMWARKGLLVEGTDLTAMCVKVIKAVIFLSNLFFKTLF